MKTHFDKAKGPFLLKCYEQWLCRTVEKNKREPLYQKCFEPILQEEKEYEENVFLSVVMRTQGRRPQALREALLCLVAQSDQDFEVVLVAHKPDEQQKKCIKEILDELDSKFRKKVRYYLLSMGKRSMPLNIGFAHARGEYIAIFDDDDIVFEDWVKEYHKAAMKAPGSVLHAFTLAQKWDALKMPSGENGLRAINAPSSLYCVPFDMISQLKENKCPPVGLAFPRVAFSEYGFHFDEELTTTEDWDFLMRVAMVFGVTDICTPTAMYRLWQNVENSSTVHPQMEWEKNYEIIQQKFQECMMISTSENMPTIMEIQAPCSAAGISDNALLSDVLLSFSWKLGRTLTYLPRVIREFVRKMRSDGLKQALRYLKQKFFSIGISAHNLFEKK